MDHNDILIYNNEDVKLLGQDFFDKVMKASKSIKKLIKHCLVLKKIISSLKSCCLYISFYDHHCVINTKNIMVFEVFSLMK